MNRRGFTLIEILMVILVLGILANLAVPAISKLRRRADAVHVIADFSVIRAAALARYATDGQFPPIESYGKVPARLEAELPKGFAFRFGKLEYCWIGLMWSDGGGSGGGGDGKGKKGGGATQPSTQHVFAGVGVRGSMDPKLMAAIRAAYRGPILYLSSTEFILMVE